MFLIYLDGHIFGTQGFGRAALCTSDGYGADWKKLIIARDLITRFGICPIEKNCSGFCRDRELPAFRAGRPARRRRRRDRRPEAQREADAQAEERRLRSEVNNFEK